MITTCTSCEARYRLDATKVPNRVIRVRCPDCAVVFQLDGTLREEPVIQAPPPALEPQMAAPTPAAAIDPMPAPAPVPTPTPAPAPAPSAAATATATETDAGVSDAPRPARRRRRDKSEMLARALVSDILVYNKDARDQALEEGNLLEALGPEIKKSWELYKEKVGAEEANDTTHFKDALNEILADGQSIF